MPSTSRMSSKEESPKAGVPRRNRSRRPHLTTEAIDSLREEIESFGDPALEGGTRGGFCYVMYEGEPLCRFGYRGNLEEWDFAIYRYSTQSFGPFEWVSPRARPRDAIMTALRAYNLR